MKDKLVMLESLAEDIHANAVEKGFWKESNNVAEKLMLMVSELSEAMEADRNDKYFKGSIEGVNGWLRDDDFKKSFETYVKDTFEDEMADVLIRLLDFCAYKKIDLISHVVAKHRYNKLRPHKHGGKKY